MSVRLSPTARGMRLAEAGAVISEVLRRPGPTHSVFDVLAAAVATLGRGPRVALLGFAAGGMLGPLRALGHAGPLVGVDLSREGWPVFRRLCGRWAGRVRLEHAEAGSWLRGRRERFDVIVDDLSVTGRAGVTKPTVSLGELPPLAARRLARGGVVVVNLLPVPGMRLAEIEAAVGRAHREVRVVHLAEFENRILIGGGDDLASARGVSRALGAALRSIGSRTARGLAVRSIMSSPKE
jgi:spermidine synthase